MKKGLLACLIALSAQSAIADDWMVRVRGIAVAPDADSSPLAGVDVDTRYVPELDITYFITPNIGLELILGTARHEVSLNGASLGHVNHLPPTLTAQYHFNPKGIVRPYVGAGLNYTRFYNVDLAPGLDVEKNSWGGTLQAGVDFKVSDNGYINLDVKKIRIKTEVTNGGAYLTDLDINPWVFGVGYGMRF